MAEKDPYLNELDDLGDLGDFQEEADPYPEEATRLDIDASAAPASHDFDPNDVELASDNQGFEGVSEHESVPGESMAKGIMQLSPDLTLPLVAVMGRKTVSVGELLEMKTGHVVSFEKIPTDPIDLVAAGQVVAKAELVNVDGRLGVRILKILK